MGADVGARPSNKGVNLTKPAQACGASRHRFIKAGFAGYGQCSPDALPVYDAGDAGLAKRGRMEPMENSYTGVFEQVGDWWIGHVEELPGCNVQERTIEEARESLKEAIQLILQANRDISRREAEGHQVVREPVAVSVE